MKRIRYRADVIRSYQQLGKILDSATQSLGQADAPVFGEQVAQWIENRTFAQVSAADAACEEFASKKKWPPMENDVRAEIHLRLEAATDLCRDMAARREKFFDFQEDQLLRMLLIEFWHGKGVDWARFRYGRSRN